MMVNNYDKIHQPITTANALQGNEIWKQCNLEESFSTISLPKQQRQLKVRCYNSPLPNHLYQQCLDLFQQNMNVLYENSSWGLDMDEKEQELSHSNARFLIVTTTTGTTGTTGTTTRSSSISASDKKREEKNNNDGDGGSSTCSGDTVDSETVVAFTHFRFECSMDECNDNNYKYDDSRTAITVSNDEQYHHSHHHHHDSILYVYEIQIGSEFQGQSLGKKLMMFMQIIGMKMNMKKVMLTVFKTNLKALDFYKNKLGYVVDESSPDDDDDDVDYEILSKFIQI